MSNPFRSPVVSPRRAYLELRVRRSVLVAAIVSLLVHLGVLFFLPALPPQSAVSGVQGGQSPLTVEMSAPEAPRPKPKTDSIKPKLASHSQPRPPVKSTPRAVIASKQANPSFVVPQTPLPTSKTPAPTKLNPADFPDMQSYIAAQRIAAGGADSTPAPSAEQTRDDIIKRNLKSGGTNGIFRILRMDSYTAEFSFRGWTNDYSNARREVIAVEKANNADIEHAIVRKMIELIRRYYKGDFQWDSQRLHRVVTLSARPVDNAGLEDFMTQEFFQQDGQLR
ncbi:MAG: hypothetical protein HOP20_03995 [Sulfuriferula sp.]|nr:hypothetical protein [Sulfuriferula sp.]